MEAFTVRSRRELQATCETVRGRGPASAGLTGQEGQVVRPASTGCTNLEIGVDLHLSPRMVEWHLRKVFTKLGVTSRRDLLRTPAA